MIISLRQQSSLGRSAIYALTALAFATAPLFCQTAGTISTVAGNGESGFSGDGGPAIQAKLGAGVLGGLLGLAVDSAGNLYIADQGNLRVRKVDAAGVITTVQCGQHLPVRFNQQPRSQNRPQWNY